MIRTLALTFTVAFALFTASAVRADETFPVDHKEPITIHILDGATGQPLVHAHVLLLGGYDQSDIDHRVWPEETLTDDHGDVHLSNQLANLPYLQVRVEKAPLCQQDAGDSSFSVERIRRDGLSAPNRCGVATVDDAPGVFAVFVKVKKAVMKQEFAATHEVLPGGQVPALPAAGQLPQLDFQPELPDELRNSSVLDVHLRLASFVR
jgi:hypothetical protein